MRLLASCVLRQHACRVTLFIRPNCGLCDNAKAVLANVWDKRPFEYDEVNIMTADQAKWRVVYEFDTPVVHFDKVPENNSGFSTSLSAKKLMHKFKESEIEASIQEVMQAA